MRKEIFSDIEIIEPKVFSDDRGNFSENFNLLRFTKLININYSFVQDNISLSKKGVFRGLHYQLKKPQGKLLQVLSGEVFDVVVDLRRNSKTYGDWMGIILSKENGKQLWVPPGFAHGFLVLSDEAKFFYKVTDYWNKDDEKCIKWDDPVIGIDFPWKPILISESDAQGKPFLEAEHFDFI
ncbi:dTDP-4-dehydrorhamnose 3,5-epimerase [SAR86 cluster bacterium]|nr:dTDP-4-dehydrorhamnose 3,5-epimerase [SAR86 cluster bacterium]